MLLLWDIYEIRAGEETLHGVKLRGRIRKFAIEYEITCLVENATDQENVVRFALITGTPAKQISDFVISLSSKVKIIDSLKEISNPVLSKLKVNDPTRYEI